MKQIGPTVAHAAGRRTKIVCVGTGRDGTLSLARMVQDVFDMTGGGRAVHEYRSREFYQSFCDYAETRDERFAEDIRRMIIECPYDCVVGNGYAAILPYFRELWGSDTKLVHVRRASRDACVASLMKSCEMFPLVYRYYSAAGTATGKRMAAFHFNEMTKEEWDGMPAVAKFIWYYDKTHALIDQYKGHFAESIEVITEDLDKTSTRAAIAKIVHGSDTTVPSAIHLNSHKFDIASVPQEHRDKAIWLLGRVDWNRLVGDDAYPIEYFLNMFSAWTGYQIRHGAELGNTKRPSATETAAALARAKIAVAAALRDVEALERLNRKRQD